MESTRASEIIAEMRILRARLEELGSELTLETAQTVGSGSSPGPRSGSPGAPQSGHLSGPR